MKAFIFSFCILLLSISTEAQPVLGTDYSYKVSGSDYVFYLFTEFSFGSGGACPRVKHVRVERSNDTVYIKALYDKTGVWAALGCGRRDTIYYTNPYTDVHYFNVSTNTYIYEDEEIPPYSDTAWNIYDTTFVLESSGMIGIPMLESSFGLYPNPVSSVLHIANQSGQPIRSWSVSDMSGKEVLQGRATEQVNVHGLCSGLYCLYVLLEDGRRVPLKLQKE